MVSGSWDHSIRIWDLDAATSELLVGHTGRAICVTFSLDGNLIATGSTDCTVRIWDAIHTNTTVVVSLNYLTSTLFPVATSSSNPAPSIPQTPTKQPKSLNLTLSTSRLAHRLIEGGWVSLTEGNVLLWLLPDHRVIDESMVQISARHVLRYSIDFSRFVHGDRWTYIASDSIRHYNLAL